ncbi:MAG: TadE/TadG family type IV pilus assembly protein, partial [Pseudomonadota bacterium]
MMKACTQTFARFRRDQRGVALIEFGFIAPVMFIMLLGVVWAADLMQANRHITYAAGTLADLTAQEKRIYDDDIDEIFLAVEETLKPYD